MPGYETDRFVDLSQNDKCELICSICQDIFKSPVVTNCCLQTFCEDCINDWLETNNSCPYDRKQLNRSSLTRPPRILINLLGKLKIRCNFRENGCKEILLLENLAQHSLSCRYNFENEDTLSREIRELKLEKIEFLRKLEDSNLERENFLRTIQELTENQNSNVSTQTTSRLSNQELLREARKHVSTPEITENKTTKEVTDKILDTVGTEIRESNSLFAFCDNIQEKLNLELGYRWICMASDNVNASVVFRYESGYLIYIKYGKLLVQIFKTQGFHVDNFRERLLSGKINREITIQWTDMRESMIANLKPIVFEAIEKLESLYEICGEISNQMHERFGGKWQCCAYSYFGDSSFHQLREKYISFKIAELTIKVFQAANS